MLFSSASTSEGARAHTGTHNGYACLPRSVTYAKVRSLTFQPTVAVLRTCLRPRPAVPIRTTLRPRPAVSICTTLRPRHSWEINDFSFTCCRSSHLSAPSPSGRRCRQMPTDEGTEAGNSLQCPIVVGWNPSGGFFDRRPERHVLTLAKMQFVFNVLLATPARRG